MIIPSYPKSFAMENVSFIKREPTPHPCHSGATQRGPKINTSLTLTSYFNIALAKQITPTISSPTTAILDNSGRYTSLFLSL